MISEILFLTFLIESLTVGTRLLFKMDAQELFEKHLKKYVKIRVHHGYIGILLAVISIFVVNDAAGRWLFIIGSALILSDVLHHFVFLPVLLKKTKFP